jgi:hypothetical protein
VSRASRMARDCPSLKLDRGIERDTFNHSIE